MISSLMRITRNPKQWMMWKYALAGKGRKCYYCGASVRRFLPYMGGTSSLSPFMSELKIVGSDIDNFTCPACDCYDRERHLLMYFDRLSLWDRVRGKRVLHIAPEEHFYHLVQDAGPLDYIRGDLNPSCPEIKRMDVTNLPFDEGRFDMVICNHVLEHVPDDSSALSEIYRVLGNEGVAILQTPYSSLLEHTFCDPGISTDELREYFYGQHDHVRVYGKDMFDRMRNAGFAVHRYSRSEVLSDIDAETYGVNAQEDLFLCSKEVVSHM